MCLPCSDVCVLTTLSYLSYARSAKSLDVILDDELQLLWSHQLLSILHLRRIRLYWIWTPKSTCLSLHFQGQRALHQIRLLSSLQRLMPLSCDCCVRLRSKPAHNGFFFFKNAVFVCWPFGGGLSFLWSNWTMVCIHPLMHSCVEQSPYWPLFVLLSIRNISKYNP